MNRTPRQTTLVLQAPIDAITWPDALGRIEHWAAQRQSRTVCICNAHSVETATQDPGFAHVLRQADMATPDGAPVAWMLRRLGHPTQQRINGPDLMLRLCERAAANGNISGAYTCACCRTHTLPSSSRARSETTCSRPATRSGASRPLCSLLLATRKKAGTNCTTIFFLWPGRTRLLPGRRALTARSSKSVVS